MGIVLNIGLKYGIILNIVFNIEIYNGNLILNIISKINVSIFIKLYNNSWFVIYFVNILFILFKIFLIIVFFFVGNINKILLYILLLL